MQIQGKEITEEMLNKAEQCESAEELIALAKEEGIELQKEQAEAFLDEIMDVELSPSDIDDVAGGGRHRLCSKFKDSGW